MSERSRPRQLARQDTEQQRKEPEDPLLVTRFKWKIHHFREFTGRQPYQLKMSQSVPIKNKKIALFFHKKKFFSTEKFGFILTETRGEQTKFDLKFWLEDRNGKKFGRREVPHYMFQKLGDKCVFILGNKLDEVLPCTVAWWGNYSLTFCCKIAVSSFSNQSAAQTSVEQIHNQAAQNEGSTITCEPSLEKQKHACHSLSKESEML